MTALSSEVSIALKGIIKSAQIVGGVAEGLKDCIVELDKDSGIFCVMANDCGESSNKKLVRDLCNEHRIPIVEVESKAELGEMVGQYKSDKDGKEKPRCSAALVTEFNSNNPDLAEAWRIVQDHISRRPTTIYPLVSDHDEIMELKRRMSALERNVRQLSLKMNGALYTINAKLDNINAKLNVNPESTDHEDRRRFELLGAPEDFASSSSSSDT